MDEGEVSDETNDGEGARHSMTWPKAIVLAGVCAFAAAAGMNAWNGRDGVQPNVADIEFFDDMTSHHLQALTMARIYEQRGDDRLLLHMADEIRFGQSGDVRVMVGQLADWGAEPDSEEAMAWMGMPVPQDAQPGMATPQELERFATLSGDELDEEFTRFMIDHHAGGIHMSEEAAKLAATEPGRNLASGMAAVQRREIGEMNFWREREGLEPLLDELDR